MAEKNSYKNFEDVKCLWMKCGLVEYKLCDKDFNCEECSFDSAVKMNLKNPSENFIYEKFFHKAPMFESFNPQYYHFDNCIVLKNFIGNNYYIGFEPYALKMLGVNCKTKFINQSDEIQKGQEFIEIYGGWGHLDLQAPMDFSYIEKIDCDNIMDSDKRWFGIIECRKDDVESFAVKRDFCEEKLSSLKAIMSANSLSYSDYFSAKGNPAGGTMLDGGNFTDNLLYIFGAKVYKRILNFTFLNQKR